MHKTIDELIHAGINPRYSAQKICIDNYKSIVAARKLGWSWDEIAGALEYAPNACKSPSGALAAAWYRTKKSLAAGKLIIPQTASRAVSTGWAARDQGTTQHVSDNPARIVIGGES